MERLRVRFFGRVQGVGFRATARDAARRWSLLGWVRNEPDGTVLAEVQGTAESIRGFLDDLTARMEGFIRDRAAEPVEIDPRCESFEVRR